MQIGKIHPNDISRGGPGKRKRHLYFFTLLPNKNATIYISGDKQYTACVSMLRIFLTKSKYRIFSNRSPQGQVNGFGGFYFHPEAPNFEINISKKDSVKSHIFFASEHTHRKPIKVQVFGKKTL